MNSYQINLSRNQSISCRSLAFLAITVPCWSQWPKTGSAPSLSELSYPRGLSYWMILNQSWTHLQCFCHNFFQLSLTCWIGLFQEKSFLRSPCCGQWRSPAGTCRMELKKVGPGFVQFGSPSSGIVKRSGWSSVSRPLDEPLISRIGTWL